MGHHSTQAGLSAFFRARWIGLVSVERLFWVDMVLVGTLINLATSFAALIALGLKWPLWAWVGVYLSPLAYNLFLVAALWRACDALTPRMANTYRAGALGWIVIATLI